jgi:hypothetical protein
MWPKTRVARGSCLCGEVVFELGDGLTQIELCHCSKCKKAYGAPFAATLYLPVDAFRWTQGEDQVTTFDAAIEESPPAYRHSFCSRCGSPLPLVWDELPFVEIPVATLDDEVAVEPEYQMFECQRLAWIQSTNRLPWYDRTAPFAEKVIRSLF